MLLLVVVACVATGWYADHKKLTRRVVAYAENDTFEQLCRTVAQRDYLVRLDGVAALAADGRDAVLAPLIYALGDPEVRIRRLARKNLESLTGRSFRDKDLNDDEHRAFLTERRRWVDWHKSRYKDSPIHSCPEFSMHLQSVQCDHKIEHLDAHTQL